jgi:hypothetical protein
MSTSSTWLTSGAAITGAGTIILNKAITIDRISIDSFGTLDISALTLTNSTIQNVPDVNNSITLSTSTNVDYCLINTTGLITAGNYLCSVTDPSIFTYCTFTGSGSTGHAIRITSPGTYSFTGNQFNGYGANGSTSAAIVNESGGLVTLNISGGGNTPTYRNISTATTVINNNVTLTITSNVTLVGAEVRIYDLDNAPAGSLGTELSGSESYGSANYAYSGTAGNSIWIQIMKNGYIEFGQQTTMPAVDGEFYALLRQDTNS